MTTLTHEHTPAIRTAARTLSKEGVLRTYDAVYRWTCECGVPQRTTRLADTIYALRHAYGWNIKTHVESGNLAVYTLVAPGDMPGDESTGTHPRRLVRDKMPTGYTPYDGQRVPVEAIPSPRLLTCSVCGQAKDAGRLLSQPLLGGYVRAKCDKCKALTTWKPVV